MTYGWADTILQPLMGVSYYEAAAAANGADSGEFLRLFMLPRETPLSSAPVLSSVSLTDIRRGPLQSGELGFGLVHRVQGRGLMSEAVRAVCDYAFGLLGLHRVQANHLPENHRSAAVLRRVGFAQEGLARELVLIDGRWRDHVLTALLAPRPPAR